MRCTHRYSYAGGRFRCEKCGQITYRRPQDGQRRKPRSKKPVLVVLLLLVPIIAAAMLWAAGSKTIIEDFGEGVSGISDSLEDAGGISKMVSDSLEDVGDIPGAVSESLENATDVPWVAENLSDSTDAIPSIIIDIPDATPIIKLVTPTPTEESIEKAKQRMLEMINEERVKAGLEAVSMGSNGAAQIHAEDMLAGCFSSHWGLDGLKPYMRYSLAGGTQYNAENISGLSYCVGSNYVAVDPVNRVRETMNGLMSSPGHRDNILDPNHAAVNIGIAADSRNMMVVQQFEYDYVDFGMEPTISGDVLSFALDIKNLEEYADGYDLSVSLYYDPPPRNLTRGQVSNTYCYEAGTTVAFFLPPLTDGSYYVENKSTIFRFGCQDPYDLPSSIPAPVSPEDASRIHGAAKTSSVPYEYAVLFVTAMEWSVHGDHFEFAADVRDVERGPGIYTVTVFVHEGGDKYIPITDYPIFHGMQHPVGYSETG